jgi:2-polyprenyl-3-methyl-5-hydroxy-6-metoxy-1,4-benzoquinol methylase
MELLEECPICSNKSFEFFLACVDHTTTSEKFNIVKCTSCSFLVTNPRPSQSEIGRYYESDKYISHSGSKNNLFDKVYHLARRYSLRQKRNLIEQFSQSRSLLDYGCGTGELITYFKKHNWKTEGIEPSPAARQKSKDLSGNPVYADIKEINKGKKFDVITLWHVLEHVHDLNKIVTDLKALLETDGKIFIAVPNPESADAKMYQENWAAYDVPRHLWHFRSDNMKSLLAKHDLKVIDVKPMMLDSYYVSMLSEKNKSGSPRLTQIAKGFMAGFQSNIKARKNNNYSSLIYIAHK